MYICRYLFIKYTEPIYFRFREPQIDLFDFELNSQDFKEVGSNHVAEIQDEDNHFLYKNVRGKVVASCKRCGNISIDIGRCTECNKILQEGNVNSFTLCVICLYFK